MIPLPTDENPVVIIHGDCAEILPQIPEGVVDAVVTDPPYGIDYGNAGGFSASHGWSSLHEGMTWDFERPSKIIFDEMRKKSSAQIVWGGNYFTDYLPPSMQWLIWDKGQRNFSLADCEIAWSSQNNAARIFTYARSLALKDGKKHPTQKPVALMRWCIQHLPKNANVILDPFAGSGTTGVAAILEGRKAILIEKDAGYVEVIKKRIAETLGRRTTLANGKVVGVNLFENIL